MKIQPPTVAGERCALSLLFRLQVGGEQRDTVRGDTYILVVLHRIRWVVVDFPPSKKNRLYAKHGEEHFLDQVSSARHSSAAPAPAAPAAAATGLSDHDDHQRIAFLAFLPSGRWSLLPIARAHA